ncbi:hypothetical protein MGN70_010574 [Eutypa lata]|nr:hypothetical protein MGN70_010574 [Eutypa lata]
MELNRVRLELTLREQLFGQAPKPCSELEVPRAVPATPTNLLNITFSTLWLICILVTCLTNSLRISAPGAKPAATTKTPLAATLRPSDTLSSAYRILRFPAITSCSPPRTSNITGEDVVGEGAIELNVDGVVVKVVGRRLRFMS